VAERKQSHLSKASEKAYEAIRSRILNGEYSPGMHLKESELAETLDVSRTPIRDALRRLSAEFWVRNVPNHGTYVCDWSPDEFEDIFSLGALLEGHAAERAAQFISNEDLDLLEADCRRMDEALADGGPEAVNRFQEINEVFHRRLRDAAASERLSSMLNLLVEQRVVILTTGAYDLEDMRRSHLHHREIVDALRARDGQWAGSVIRAHVAAAFQAFRLSHQRTRAGQPH
jgi:DNA-binding GntR family transcriptional regulator